MYPGGPVRHSYGRVDYVPQKGTKNLATELQGMFGGLASQIPDYV